MSKLLWSNKPIFSFDPITNTGKVIIPKGN